jgi:polar amino acid transport system substrate-binding protein
MVWCLAAVMLTYGVQPVRGKTFRADSVRLSLTAQERAYLDSKNGVISYGIDPDYLPFEGLDASGRHIGMSADVLELISERTGIKLSLEPTKDWPQTLDMARRRDFDMLALAAKTENRSQYLDFTDPYIEVQAVIATLMHRPFYSDISEIIDKRIGVVKGYSFKEQMLAQYPSMNLVEVGTVNEGLMRVQAGDLYGVVGNMATIGYRIQQAKMNNVKIAGRIEGDIFFHLASRNDEPLLGSILQKAVRTISKEEMQEISNRWWGVRYEHATDYTLVLKLAAGFLLAVGAILFWLMKVRQLNLRLKQVNAQLEELNTQKDFYFSVIGHDLRNPFMNVVGFAELLHDDLDRLPAEETRHAARVIRDKSRLVLGMLNQLLDWARLEIKQVEKRESDVALDELVDVVFKLHRETAAAKEIRLLNTVPPELVWKTDPYMTAAILRNLVSNAIKYSRAGDQITVGFEPETATWFVRDTGLGMDEETRSSLFSLKPRKSRAGTANETGTGLGLTICLRYASLMGATFSVESAPGDGTTIRMKLPAAPTA